MRPEPGDNVQYKLGKTLVDGEWVDELGDDIGFVVTSSDNDVAVLWSVSQRIEHHAPGDLFVAIRRAK